MEIRMTAPPSDPLPSNWNHDQRIGDMLKGKRGLVVGIANANSIALGGSCSSRGGRKHHGHCRSYAVRYSLISRLMP